MAIEIQAKNPVIRLGVPGPQSNVQPDWNQNDDTQPDYVKNRTHYEEVLNEYVIFEGTLPNFDTTRDLPLQYAIPSDASVTAYYNGRVVATVVGYYPGSSFAVGTLHYGFLPDLTLTVDNSTMKASVYNGMGDGVLKFAVADFTMVHPLDKKYITDDIARVEDIPVSLPNPHKLTFTGAVEAEYDGSEAVEVVIPEGGGGGIPLPPTAEVGQYFKVSAVENGKVTAVEAVDAPSGVGVWEHICDITTTEQVDAGIVVTENSQGVPLSELKYNEIWVLAKMVGVDTNTHNWWACNCAVHQTDNEIYRGTANPGVSGGTKGIKYVSYYTFIRGGKAYWTDCTSIDPYDITGGNQAWLNNFLDKYLFDYFTSVTLMADSTRIIGADTEVRILGRRGN